MKDVDIPKDSDHLVNVPFRHSSRWKALNQRDSWRIASKPPKSYHFDMKILAKNLLILASAGSGKTFQLGNRVIGLVAGGVEPSEIVALTFTRKAAGEFADSVLTKLARAASDETDAARLRKDLDLPEADFSSTLERIIRALPRFTLSTMDSFFARIVRGFQYELGLTGGTFELVEGPRAAALADEILSSILGDALVRQQDEEFFHAFRRASVGKEEQGVLKSLRSYVNTWQARYQESTTIEWGPARLSPHPIEDWEKHKTAMAEGIRRESVAIAFTDSRQPAALAKCISHLEAHTIGSGSLGGSIPTLLENLFEAVATTDTGPLHVKCYKDFAIGGSCASGLREMIQLAARCELSAALQRTRSVRNIVSVYDSLCSSRLRRRGLLGFHDVKILMGEWSRDEDARLRREAVDYRLDARIHHWLLDEFQDTSRADWTGLLPLVDEAATGEDGSMFIVGDRKQSIYAWRGGDESLFDDVIHRYGARLDIEPMAESWRSCPQVLDLVNRICGDMEVMDRLFGNAASRWIWEPHFPAKPLEAHDKAGESRVESVGDWEQRLQRLAELLAETGVGSRSMTCGVLLRGNEKVKETADFLRAEGFDVIEEGRREPAKDNPPGIFIIHLVRWLANPADGFAKGVIAMSPLASGLLQAHGNDWHKLWSQLTLRISRQGLSSTIESVIDTATATWSDFGRRRAGDLMAALRAIELKGITSLAEAADWLGRLEVSQSPGMAAVQVMTIHKSKGLGFDVVVLPDVPEDEVPLAHRFDVAESDEWITETPPKWARSLIPEMREAEKRWADAQRYEAFCTLYVALTRAKRGLYVLMEPPKPKADPDKPSLANWIRQTLPEADESGILHQSGSAEWVEGVPAFESAASRSSAPPLGPAVPMPQRYTGTTDSSHPGMRKLRNPGGMAFGKEIHALLETVSWMDETDIRLPENPAGQAARRLLESPQLRAIFHRAGRPVILLREQPVDGFMNGRHFSGVIDRLHLHQDATGNTELIEIIDFKSDSCDHPDQLRSRHQTQLDSYRDALRLIHPSATIRSLIVSIPLACVIEV